MMKSVVHLMVGMDFFIRAIFTVSLLLLGIYYTFKVKTKINLFYRYILFFFLIGSLIVIIPNLYVYILDKL